MAYNKPPAAAAHTRHPRSPTCSLPPSQVVVRLVQRPADAQATNSLIKDTMRATDVVKNLCAFFYNVTLACREKNKALTCSCLQTFAKFIPWISVDLVANDK